MEINDEIGSTIIAFLNLLTADLRIEELASIEEASNLIDILINLANTGHLNFTNNGGTFAKATEFVKDKLGSAFIQQILPESADRTDQQEKIMVLLGLIYTLRLAHGPLFLELSDRLDVHNNKWIAMLIAQLDNHERWTPISGPPPASGTPARSDSQSPSGNKENITASNYHLNDTPPNHSSPSRTATSSTGNRSSPFVIRRTPTTMKKQRYRLNFDSPVEKVLNSPRGGEVEQIYSLREEVKSLRELRDKLGREKDEQDELCKQKDEQIILLRQQIGRLESKISRILPQAERSSTLDERILKLEEQNNNLEKECRAQKNNFAASEGNLSIVRFERDEALQKVDLLEDNLKHLKGEYEKALTRSQDEMAMHERTRKKLTDIEFQTGTELNAMSARLREMESTVEEEKQVCRAQVEQKQRQMEEQLQMINQIREHSEEPERQMRIELEETRQTLNELYGICDAQRARITELEKSKTVVREQEQQIRELKEKQSQLTRSHAMDLKKMQKDLERKEAELDSIKSIKSNLELELDQMRNSVGQQEESDRKVAELEADNLQLIQENVRLQKNQSALIDQHTKEINSLQQALKAKDSKNNNCMTPQRTSSSSLSSAMKNPNLTPSMRVVFTPYRSKMESKISASVEELSTANGGGDSTLLGTTTTASQEDSGNQDDRLKELRERNRRYQPHMRSNYLPEVAHLKSSNPELNKIY